MNLGRDAVLVQHLLDVGGGRLLGGAGIEPDQGLIVPHRLVLDRLPVGGGAAPWAASAAVETMASAARSRECLVITIDADYNHRMDRRRFLARTAAGAVGWVQVTRLAAQALQAPADAVPRGQSPLGISDDGRDGVLFVPASYRDTVPAPLLVMLHGYGGWADEMKSTFSLAEEFGVVVIAPESRDVTWGRESPGFDEDVRYIGAAYRKVTKLVNIDPARVGLGGRSDGAGYALTMGLAYGDIFNHLIVIAGGRMNPIRRKGKRRSSSPTGQTIR